jgi:hypothetical protein
MYKFDGKPRKKVFKHKNGCTRVTKNQHIKGNGIDLRVWGGKTRYAGALLYGAWGSNPAATGAASQKLTIAHSKHIFPFPFLFQRRTRKVWNERKLFVLVKKFHRTDHCCKTTTA